MEITGIIIRRISLESKMKAIVSITFDNAFVVHDVKVIEGANLRIVVIRSIRDFVKSFQRPCSKSINLRLKIM